MNLVILPLDFWMTNEMYYDDCDIVECEPVYGRDRIFMIGDKWWFENNGSAYTYNTPKGIDNAIKQTKYNLSVSDENILRESDLAAMNILIYCNKDSILKKRLSSLLAKHRDAVAIRETGRMTRKFALRRLK